MRHEAAFEDDLGEPDNETRDAHRRAFFSSQGTIKPSPNLLGYVARLVAEPRNDCLFLGPSGAGKTALLSSLGQACAMAGSQGLALLPHEDLAALTGEAEAYRHGAGNWKPTGATTTYGFQLRAGADEFFLNVQDGPGGLLFPFSPARWDALPEPEKSAYDAACLVLCIDSTDPRPDLWRTSLPQLLARFAKPSGSLIPRLTAPPPARGADFPHLLTPSWQLPYHRVLVSLTRIDAIVQEALQGYTAGYRQARGRMPPPPSATELALQIDSFRLLDDQVGAILGQVHAAAPTADLAVGLTSAWGLPGSGGGWSPFGVREALLFLATGECREPVVRYAPNAVEENDASSWIELPFAFSPPGDDQ
jgi:hypothetical protein